MINLINSFFFVLILIKFCSLPIVQGFPPKSADYAGWTLVWSDEFNGPAGSPPNSSNWVYDIGDRNAGGNGWGNQELQYYTNSTKNSRHDGKGNLIIEARRNTNASMACYYGTCNYTSARLTTAGKFSHKYGRIEAKIRIPFGQGLWPALWMLGNSYYTGSRVWPACGEIDILENVGKEPLQIHGALHGPSYDPQVTYNSTCPMSDGFHRYGIVWNEEEISWYVDQQFYGRVNASAAPSNGWVFNDDEFFILLNVAVGGSWPGNPDASTRFPQQMVLDYVRVYQPRK